MHCAYAENVALLVDIHLSSHTVQACWNYTIIISAVYYFDMVCYSTCQATISLGQSALTQKYSVSVSSSQPVSYYPV